MCIRLDIWTHRQELHLSINGSTPPLSVPLLQVPRNYQRLSMQHRVKHAAESTQETWKLLPFSQGTLLGTKLTVFPDKHCSMGKHCTTESALCPRASSTVSCRAYFSGRVCVCPLGLWCLLGKGSQCRQNFVDT